ncbi:hypothetical protein GCM10022240_26000 [Microbacterium kribbense]|uniref:Ig-like domain-containing protein n=1 Tax=Microbacterium kribbense TaxID=433645 RepID=A0ABP7GRI3_9MICO
MSHRRLRAARSLIAVTALALAVLIAPQAASADAPPPPPTPTAVTVTAQSDPALAASIAGVPAGAIPAVLAAVHVDFDIQVTLKDNTGADATWGTDATVTLRTDGGGTLSTTTKTIPAGTSSIHILTAYSQATAALTVTADVTSPVAPATILTGPAAPFPVDLHLTVLDGNDASLLNGTAGADAAGCAVVDATHPMCGILSLPRGAQGTTALTLGVCPTGATCAPGGLVTQFLGDLTAPGGADLYTRTAPASMTIICDKTLCGQRGVASFRAQWSESATGALTVAPPCLAKGVIGADQRFCTDLASSSRTNVGDLRLVVLFLHDVRGTI